MYICLALKQNRWEINILPMKRKFIIISLVVVSLIFIGLLSYFKDYDKRPISVDKAHEILNMPILFIEQEKFSNKEAIKINLFFDENKQPYAYNAMYTYFLDNDEYEQNIFVVIHGNKSKEKQVPKLYYEDYEVLQAKSFNVNNIEIEKKIVKNRNSNRNEILYYFCIDSFNYEFRFKLIEKSLIKMEKLTDSLTIKTLESWLNSN